FRMETTMRGRYPAGPESVEQLQGSDKAKERVRVILETIQGKLRVQQACDLLGISEQRHRQLRAQMLQAAVAGVEDQPSGRPAGAGPAGTGANANRGRHAAASVRAGEERAFPAVACRAAPRRASGSGQRLRVSPERRRAALPAPRPASDRAAAFAAAHSSGSGGLLSRLAGAVPDARALRPVAGAVAANVALLGAA